MAQINLITYKNPKNPVSEAFRTIRTNIQFAGAWIKKLRSLP